MIIPGFIIAMVTFPGVIVHELAHQFFCRLFKVPVFKVCYFRVGNPSGYVIHEPPSSPWTSLLIGIGPLFVNSVVGPLVALPAVLGLKFNSGGGAEGFDLVMVWINMFLIWLGFSIAMHSFPSTGDAASIWKKITESGHSIWLKIVGVPLVGLIWAGAVGSVFWLDAIYGGFIVGFLPGILVHAIAAL
jgi:hypothetical protein